MSLSLSNQKLCPTVFCEGLNKYKCVLALVPADGALSGHLGRLCPGLDMNLCINAM